MRKNLNNEHIEGRLYQHSLEVKTVKNQQSANFGKPFIGGKIEIATDEQGLNVVPVEFTYVAPQTKAGGTNKTYTELMKIIESGKTWITDGADAATKVSVDTALALNDFYVQEGDKEVLVSQKINQGGFVTVVAELKEDVNQRSTFQTDMLITNVTRVDADPERNIDADYVRVHGAVFDFKNSLLPVEFVVRNPGGMEYFENLGATGAEPVYTKVWGKIVNATTSIPVTEETAFGEVAVTSRERKIREWVITGASKVPYDFGDEKVMTMDEVVKANQDRQVYLADKKRQREEYLAQKNAATPAASAGFPTTPAPTTPVMAPVGKFTF